MVEVPKDQKAALCLGAGGFICGHFSEFLKQKGYWVRGVDIKHHEFKGMKLDDFHLGDLRYRKTWDKVMDENFDLLVVMSHDMGGAGFCFTGENDASIMHNSGMVNMLACEYAYSHDVEEILYTSSACIYPQEYQVDSDENYELKEEQAYPANPDSEYGWEKLFSERIYQSFERNYGLNVTKIRLHNIFGREGAWRGGREKAPAAICRKVAEAAETDEIDVWGDGTQVRTFLHIDECLEGLWRLLNSDFNGPVNLGSDEDVTINEFVDMIADIAGKDISKNHLPNKPTGVAARSSDNTLIEEKIGWKPKKPLKEGMKSLYSWVEDQVKKYGDREYVDKIGQNLKLGD